jgi:hypothetical protein
MAGPSDPLSGKLSQLSSADGRLSVSRLRHCRRESSTCAVIFAAPAFLPSQEMLREIQALFGAITGDGAVRT